jgi:hypothetical protein
MSIIKQIAADCGVSMATVGHILGNKRHMHSEETCVRVLSHAEKLGYRPNSSAKAIGSGRFRCATLLLSTHPTKSNLPDEKLTGIHDALDAHDYHLNIARMTDERMAFDVSLPKFLRQWMTDGILVNYTSEIPERILEGIHADRAPVIWINSKQDGDCVRPDDYLAGYQATERLLDLGHRRIRYAAFSRLSGGHGKRRSRAAPRKPCDFDLGMELARALLVRSGGPADGGRRLRGNAGIGDRIRRGAGGTAGAGGFLPGRLRECSCGESGDGPKIHYMARAGIRRRHARG